MLNRAVRFFLENKLVTVLLLLLFVGWGLVTAPFNWEMDWLPRDPVPVDAIPDIGPNQQIVFTKWPGRSPQDIQDQITYPLTTALLGVPGVKSVRSSSMFGFSSIYIIFEEDVDFYWSRSRILEKLNSLPSGTLPDGVQPSLGPDATALGQIYWYTLEGRNPKTGKPAGGWDPHELRTIQDYQVKYALSSVKGVAEVASVGGYVKQYQVDLDPAALKAHDVSLAQVMKAVKESNIDVGAKTVEINRAEYFVRGIGYIENTEDIDQAVITSRNNTPIRIRDVANVTIGPAPRRGALDKTGAEVAGGVVVARYGSNPMAVIDRVKEKINNIEPGLPKKTLDDGTVSQVNIVPFYDRTELIMETLGTLEQALTLQVLVTILVVIIMVINLRASLLISGLLPVAVLMCFIAMRYFGVDANIVALSGIAIAIGTIVDMGVILTENMLRHVKKADENESSLEVVYRATSEVSGAVLTAIMTTIVSFLPVFTMQQAEGKLFRPLAFTKTFVLIASIIIALFILPAFAQWIMGRSRKKGALLQTLPLQGLKKYNGLIWGALLLIGGSLFFAYSLSWAGMVLIAFGVIRIAAFFLPEAISRYRDYANFAVIILAVAWLLAWEWLPLGPSHTLFVNLLFILLLLAPILGLFLVIIQFYSHILRWCLRNKGAFLTVTLAVILWGLTSWLGWNTMFGFVKKGFNNVNVQIEKTDGWQTMAKAFPGIGKEFMPALSEGAFLLMPTSMPHSGVEENLEVTKQLDLRVAAIPEVDEVVGKVGRVESALDPAPMSMYENIINYKPEYKTDEDGNRIRFRVNEKGEYVRDSAGHLIPDPDGRYYRNWRDHIESPDDIWQEIVDATNLPGVTSAPKLQPIETRLVMLQTGMRAPMGMKVFGPDLETINSFASKLEKELKQVPSIKSKTVFADQVVGKPYLNIKWDRKKLGRYGLTMKQVQRYLEVAIGGVKQTTSVEGRKRFPVRIRYAREYRDDPQAIKNIYIPAPNGSRVPLGELADITYERGPQAIKSEETFLVGYVTFDRNQGRAEVDVVEEAQKHLQEQIDKGNLKVPDGVSYKFAGNYQNQVRAEKRLSIVIPLSLIIIFLILYFQFRSVLTTSMIFTSILVAVSGGFILLWLYGQPWFMDFSLLGTGMRDLFNMGDVNLSIAVWVGFIALFGIATDGAVVVATYLDQIFERKKPETLEQVRESVVEAGAIRIRPTLMTTATTILALLPVLSSTGRGSDVMIPMAIPSFGGMLVQVVTLFVIPVLYSLWKEKRIKK